MGSEVCVRLPLMGAHSLLVLCIGVVLGETRVRPEAWWSSRTLIMLSHRILS